MMCRWQELLQILPKWLSDEVDRHRQDGIQEIRLRTGCFPELNMGRRCSLINRIVTGGDLEFIVNSASRYSPWAASTAQHGFLTASGGHRIGICGETVTQNGFVAGIRKVNSLCIRIARDYSGIGKHIAGYRESVLILGPPGSGKTTLLRDVLRNLAELHTVSVVDERYELFPNQFIRGKRMDILSGCPKAEGIDIVLRTMGPEYIGVDEITSERDCEAMIRAGWCGVGLAATAHAASLEDMKCRPIYRKLWECGLFSRYIVMNREKVWHEERIVV